MNKHLNRPILSVRLHHNNVFVDKVNVAMDGTLTTPLQTAQGEKLVNLSIEGDFLVITLANKAKSKNAVLLPLTNVMSITLGPVDEQKQETKK